MHTFCQLVQKYAIFRPLLSHFIKIYLTILLPPPPGGGMGCKTENKHLYSERRVHFLPMLSPRRGDISSGNPLSTG